MYTSFIRPKLEYAGVLFAGAPDNQLVKLQKVEYEAHKVITGAISRTPSKRILEELQTYPLSIRRDIQVLRQFFKIHNKTAPVYLQHILNDFIYRPVYVLRNAPDYTTPFSRSSAYLNSYFPRTIRIWNRLDYNIRNSNNIYEMIIKIHPKIKKEKILYYGERWSNIHHTRLRLGCSQLNYDLFHNIHVIDTPVCPCGHQIESAEHIFLHCHLYDALRTKLLNDLNIINKDLVVDINLILNGSKNKNYETNRKIFNAVHAFLKNPRHFI
jgi:hypothetical protein